eukprot:s215_g3.t3
MKILVARATIIRFKETLQSGVACKMLFFLAFLTFTACSGLRDSASLTEVSGPGPLGGPRQRSRTRSQSSSGSRSSSSRSSASSSSSSGRFVSGGGGWDADHTTAPVVRTPEERQEDDDREDFWRREPLYKMQEFGNFRVITTHGFSMFRIKLMWLNALECKHNEGPSGKTDSTMGKCIANKEKKELHNGDTVNSRWHVGFHTNNTKFDCFKKKSFLKRIFKNPFKFQTELVFPANTSYAAIQWDEGAAAGSWQKGARAARRWVNLSRGEFVGWLRSSTMEQQQPQQFQPHSQHFEDMRFCGDESRGDGPRMGPGPTLHRGAGDVEAPRSAVGGHHNLSYGVRESAATHWQHGLQQHVPSDRSLTPVLVQWLHHQWGSPWAMGQSAAAAATCDPAPKESELSAARGMSKQKKKKKYYKFWCHFYLEPSMLCPGFDVNKKIIGHGGANTRLIFQQTGAKVRLRGRGSRHLEGEREAPVHLMLAVTSSNQQNFLHAVDMSSQLLHRVTSTFPDFCARRGHGPVPQPLFWIGETSPDAPVSLEGSQGITEGTLASGATALGSEGYWVWVEFYCLLGVEPVWVEM